MLTSKDCVMGIGGPKDSVYFIQICMSRDFNHCTASVVAQCNSFTLPCNQQIAHLSAMSVAVYLSCPQLHPDEGN